MTGQGINSVYVAASLDGYIATEDGGVEWLENLPNPDESDFGFAEFTGRIDALVMGRGTFETVLDFGQWPYDVPVVVMSSTVAEVPDWVNEAEAGVEVWTGSPDDVIARCADRGWHRLYIDGGALITSFLAEDLIDEMIITTVPVTLGAGIPLFGSAEDRARSAVVREWELVSAGSFSNGFVQTHHRRSRV